MSEIEFVSAEVEGQAFEKGYLPDWTEEIFTISKRITKERPICKDDSGEILEGSFYEEELQKVIKGDYIYIYI